MPNWRFPLGTPYNAVLDIHLLYEAVVACGAIDDAAAVPHLLWLELFNVATTDANGSRLSQHALSALFTPAQMREIFCERLQGFFVFMAELVMRFEEKQEAQQQQVQQQLPELQVQPLQQQQPPPHPHHHYHYSHQQQQPLPPSSNQASQPPHTAAPAQKPQPRSNSSAPPAQGAAAAATTSTSTVATAGHPQAVRGRPKPRPPQLSDQPEVSDPAAGRSRAEGPSSRTRAQHGSGTVAALSTSRWGPAVQDLQQVSVPKSWAVHCGLLVSRHVVALVFEL